MQFRTMRWLVACWLAVALLACGTPASGQAPIASGQAQSAGGAASAAVAAAPPSPAVVATKTDELIAAYQKTLKFSGAVLIARDGQVLVSKGYGMANFELGVPNTPQTKFRLGSITKQFTATAILLLQEREKLSVQDSICKYLEPCPATWQPITVHHLLTHTSGIPSYTNSPDYRKNMMTPYQPDEMVAGFRDKPLEFEPGSNYRYNNSGYFLLGRIVEKVAGQSYEDFLRANIFEPLGMKNSGYDRSERLMPQRAAGYSRQGDELVNAAYLDMGQPYSAGSLYSTVEDLLIWDRALVAGKLLSAKSYEAMWTPFKSDYAYGWAVGARLNRKFNGHGGGINGFSTHIARYPDDKVCVIVLSNVENANAARVSRDLEAMVLGDTYELPRERVAIKLDPAIYDAYVGVYELRPGFNLTVTREGDKLITQATGQGKLEVFPESETKFFLRMIDAQITFVKGSDGKVTHLILHQGGDRTARKIQ